MIKKIAVLGGAGHIGLPLSLMLAKNFMVTIIDPSKNVELIKKGVKPFDENQIDTYLKNKNLMNNIDYLKSIDEAKNNFFDCLIITLGTPVDEWGNPVTDYFLNFTLNASKKVRKNGLIILRSTVTPGLTDKIYSLLNKRVNISFCPERIAQGLSFDEMNTLPQIIGVNDNSSFKKSVEIFKTLTDKILRTTPLNAEFAKLFANFWRYSTFAVSNQIYITAKKYNTDPNEIINLIKKDYPRAAGLPYPGLAAGPCLYKDTVQLIASLDNEFGLGSACTNVNEGVVYTITNEAIKLQEKYKKNIVILGAAFKANNDDYRSSLSFKLHKALTLRSSMKILFHDPYVDHIKVEKNINLKDIKNSIIVVATPHKVFKKYKSYIKKDMLIDVWNFI